MKLFKSLLIASLLLLAAQAGHSQGRTPDRPLPKWEGLADTPQMGWSSWNKFQTEINETLIKDIADKMVEYGLVDAGYVYLNLDDGWHGSATDRDSSTRIWRNSLRA